jgi:aminocarboxymuconate-semialdehyde decarboxylase
MRIIDSHFHWWPRSVSERFCKRTTYPRAEVNTKGGYTYMRQKRADYELSSWAEWFDLDKQLEHMDGLGHQVDVVCSIGPFSVFFSELPPEEGREAAIHWNEEMAGAQKKYPGRLWASAAVPLRYPVAIEVLDDAVNRLGLMGSTCRAASGPMRASTPNGSAVLCPREAGLPLFLHPTDAVFGHARRL